MASFDDVDLDAFALDNFDSPVFRLSLGMDLFFGRPMDEHREEVLGLWHALLEWRGRDRFTWARLGGGSKSRTMSAASYRTIEGWLRGSRSYGDHCFITVDSGDFEEIGDEGFRLDGNNRPIEDEDDIDINFVQLRLPLSVADDPDPLVERLCELASPLRYVCGSAGLKLHTTSFGAGRFNAQVHELVSRYQGVEPDMAEKIAWMAGEGVGTVNWLTFVGPPHLETLGGVKAVQEAAAAHEGLSVDAAGHGVVVRAGERPRVGDREGDPADLEPYRDAYALLEPVLYLLGDFGFDDDHFDTEQTLAWQRRLSRDAAAD